MQSFAGRLVTVLFLLLSMCAVATHADTPPQLTVTGLQLVSTTRIDRVRYDYTYRVVVRNDSGKWLGAVAGTATSPSAATELLDGEAAFGDLQVGQTATSTDTIKLRQDRSKPFATLAWNLTGFVPARVEIDPAAILLQPNTSQAISGVLLDAQGQRLTGRPMTWTALTPDIASIDAQGLVTANATLGIGRVRAQFGALISNPSLVTVAVLAPGVRTIRDADIVAGPTDIDPTLRPSLGNPYEVVVRGGMNFVAGQKLVNTGLAPVGGEIQVVYDEGGNQRLRLVLVPLPQLLAKYSVDETFDITEDIEIPARVLEDYDVTVEGSKYSFTPKASGSSLAPAKSERSIAESRGKSSVAARNSTTNALAAAGGALGTSAEDESCEFENEGTAPLGVPFPFVISGGPQITITLDGEFQVAADDTAGLKKYALKAKPTFELEDKISVAAAFSGKATCEFVWLERTIPFPGVLGLFLGTILEFGPGVELSGQITVASIEAGAKLTVGGELGWDLTCGPSNCDADFVASAPADKRKFKPEFTADPFEPKIEAELSLFGFAKAKIGSPLIQSLQLEVLGAQLGFGFEGEFAVPAVQAASADLASNYSLTLKAALEPGESIQDLLDELGFSGVTVPSLEVTTAEALAESPKGSFSLDRASYLAGETVNARISLDAATTDFLVVPYNIDRIEIRRSTGPLTTELLDTITPVGDPLEIQTSFPAPGLLRAEDVFVFVVTKMLPAEILGLEMTREVKGIAASGGVFDSPLLAERGTALLLKLRMADSALVPVNTTVTIAGPPASGWNGGNTLNLFYPAAAVRQFYILNQVVRAGTYTASATIDGQPVQTTFVIDPANSLPRPANIKGKKLSSTSASATWDSLNGAQSYQSRVVNRTAQTLLDPRVFSVAPLARVDGLTPAMDATSIYAYQVFAINTDLTITDPVMPSQFNVSFERTVLDSSVAVVPAKLDNFPLDESFTFRAVVTGIADTRVTWSANGGTIDANGVFTAPSLMPNVPQARVVARSVALPDVSGSALVTLRDTGACSAAIAKTLFDGTYDVRVAGGSTQNCSTVPQFANFLARGSFTIVDGRVYFSDSIRATAGGSRSGPGPGTYSCLNVNGNLTPVFFTPGNTNNPPTRYSQLTFGGVIDVLLVSDTFPALQPCQGTISSWSKRPQ